MACRIWQKENNILGFSINYPVTQDLRFWYERDGLKNILDNEPEPTTWDQVRCNPGSLFGSNERRSSTVWHRIQTRISESLNRDNRYHDNPPYTILIPYWPTGLDISILLNTKIKNLSLYIIISDQIVPGEFDLVNGFNEILACLCLIDELIKLVHGFIPEINLVYKNHIPMFKMNAILSTDIDMHELYFVSNYSLIEGGLVLSSNKEIAAVIRKKKINHWVWYNYKKIILQENLPAQLAEEVDSRFFTDEYEIYDSKISWFEMLQHLDMDDAVEYFGWLTDRFLSIIS